MENREKDRKAELDAFWEIDALIPRRRVPPYAANTDTTDVFVEPPQGEKKAPEVHSIPPRPVGQGDREPDKAPEVHFIPPHRPEPKKPEPDVEYTPDHALLRTVRLYRAGGEHRYYEAFVRDAVRLYPIHGEACARVPYFSYVPQYSQLSRAQLEWYLWWRDRVRAGDYPDTDYSYVLLYLYELINLSDRLEPGQVQAAMVAVWSHYREVFRQLDTYLPDWICHVGLLHRLPAPMDALGELGGFAMSHCRLREYYVASAASDGYARALLTVCTKYDYHKSKFYTEESRELFDTAMQGGIKAVLDHMDRDGALLASFRPDHGRILLESFNGALCASRNKWRMEVEYDSFSIHALVTDIVKYIENRVRAVLSVRSRLSVYQLPDGVRAILDEYLNGVLPTRSRAEEKRREAAEAEEHYYASLYDLPKTPLSLKNAAKIEQASWETTRRLVEAFEEGEQEPVSALMPNIPLGDEPKPTEKSETNDTRPPFLPYTAFLRASLEGNTRAERDYAAAVGKMLDAVADEINELAVEEMGDILLEDNGEGYEVIPDYRPWLSEKMKELNTEDLI